MRKPFELSPQSLIYFYYYYDDCPPSPIPFFITRQPLISPPSIKKTFITTNTPQSKQPFRYPRAHRESLHWCLLINLIFLQQIISSPHFPALFPTSYPSTHSPIPAVLLFPPSPLPPVHNDIHQWNSRSNKSRFLPMLVPRLPDGGNGETGNSRCWTDSLRWNSHAETPPTLSKYLPRETRTPEPMG